MYNQNLKTASYDSDFIAEITENAIFKTAYEMFKDGLQGGATYLKTPFFDAVNRRIAANLNTEEV
jgi:hypothetical protein